MSAETPENPKSTSKAYEWVAPGIYRYLKAGTLYERPWINGRRTMCVHWAQRICKRPNTNFVAAEDYQPDRGAAADPR